MYENLENNLSGSEGWDFEAEQNWLGFWDLITKEYIRQNPEEYKKLKEENNENNRNTNNSHTA
ncbi:MAG: hypothetical protein NT155_04055 [Candidatus Staskawiczbacteria bacterium]|nr:hypothetical protein [Candidatus Staskawiczbacteria bacterium]